MAQGFVSLGNLLDKIRAELDQSFCLKYLQVQKMDQEYFQQ